MRRALLVLAALAAAAGVVAVAFWAGGPSGRAVAGAASVEATGTLSPSTPRFADPVTAQLDVVVDRTRVDLASMKVAPKFVPYRIVAIERSRSDAGDASLLRYRFRLDCLARECLGTEQAQTVFQATIAYRGRTGSARLRTDVSWPALRVSSRLDPGDVGRPKLRSGLVPLPRPSYRLAPGTAAWFLTALALLLALAGVALVAHALGPARSRIAVRVPRRTPSPVERALALLREASARGDATAERKALERLAWELRQAHEERLARDARRLAWSEPGPAPEPVGALTEAVTKTVRRNGR